MNSTVRIADVTDGLSNTLIIGERPPSADFVMGWWYAGWGQNHTGETDALLGVRTRNLDIYAAGCPRGPYAYEPGSFENMCSAFHFWSPHAGGANFAFADGSVRLITYDLNPIMPDLASRAGGEAVEAPE